MIIDGKKIAQDIQESLKQKVEVLGTAPVLAIVVVGENPVIESFVRIKKEFAEKLGVHVEEHRFSSSISTDKLLKKVEELSLDESVHGIVVQLPLPPEVDTEAIFGAIPASKDVDVLSKEGQVLFETGELDILPPVTGAIREIISREGMQIKEKKAVVVGNGKLVGYPTAVWLKREGVDVTTLTRNSGDTKEKIKQADMLVLGAGSPGMILPDMIKEGAALFDAGTSEDKGRLIGDANKVCADKCSIFTPVPGGIGPITVAVLFQNLFTLFLGREQ